MLFEPLLSLPLISLRIIWVAWIIIDNPKKYQADKKSRRRTYKLIKHLKYDEYSKRAKIPWRNVISQLLCSHLKVINSIRLSTIHTYTNTQTHSHTLTWSERTYEFEIFAFSLQQRFYPSFLRSYSSVTLRTGHFYGDVERCTAPYV